MLRKKRRKDKKKKTNSKKLNKKWPADYETKPYEHIEYDDNNQTSNINESFNNTSSNPFITTIKQILSALNPKHYLPKNIGHNIERTLDSQEIKKITKVCLIVIVVFIVVSIIGVIGLIVGGGNFLRNNIFTFKLPIM